MSLPEIPVQIKKTLALLKSQMKKTELKGTYLVFKDSVTYILDQQSQIIDVEDSKRESEGRRLHHKMPEFVKDLHRNKTISRELKLPQGDTWEKKISYTCNQIRPNHINCKSQLPYYYNLGALMEEKAWNPSAREVVKRLRTHRFPDILIAAQRTYEIYMAHGPYYLFLT